MGCTKVGGLCTPPRRVADMAHVWPQSLPAVLGANVKTSTLGNDARPSTYSYFMNWLGIYPSWLFDMSMFHHHHVVSSTEQSC